MLPRLVCSSESCCLSISSALTTHAMSPPSGHYVLIFPLLLFSKFSVLISHVLGLTRFPPRSFSLAMINPLIYCVCVSVHTSHGMPVEVRGQTAGATSPFSLWDPKT